MDDFDEFARLVHEVYPHLHDRGYLQDHPLLRLIGPSPNLGAERLHRTLIDALEWLRPLGTVSLTSVEWRRFRLLQLRYVEGAGPEQVARELQISSRQARRDHAEALQEVARLLWSRLAQPDAAARSGRLPIPRSGTAPPRPTVADPLDAELMNLTVPAGPTEVAEVIRGVVDTVSRLAASNGVRIRIDASPTMTPVVANRTVLRQLLLSLLSEILVRHPGATVEIRAEALPAAFDLVFAIADQPQPTAPKGMTASNPAGDQSADLSASGFDLATRLARRLGFALRTESQPDQTTIRMTLATAPVQTLLLVDDNPDLALLFRRFLGDQAYQVVQARSAERALRLARELQPSVVFLDVLMPSHDGWEILQALRADPLTARLPVVVCSVVPDHALAYSLGVSDFLHKPVTRAALLDLLGRIPTRDPAGGRSDQPAPSDSTPPR
jgi:CheY-like chemotaxis protein